MVWIVTRFVILLKEDAGILNHNAYLKFKFYFLKQELNMHSKFVFGKT